MDQDDLRSELRIVLLKTARAYDGTRAGFHTFLHVCLRNWIFTQIKVAKIRRIPSSACITVEDALFVFAANTSCRDAAFEDAIRHSNLSDKSRAVIALVMMGLLPTRSKKQFELGLLGKFGISRDDWPTIKREIREFLNAGAK